MLDPHVLLKELNEAANHIEQEIKNGSSCDTPEMALLLAVDAVRNAVAIAMMPEAIAAALEKTQ